MLISYAPGGNGDCADTAYAEISVVPCGCTDPLAINYDSIACFDNGSCITPILGCTNSSASNFDPNANTTVAFGGALNNSFASGGYFNADQHLNLGWDGTLLKGK